LVAFSRCSARETKREIRREAILTAAYDLFLEKGYDATTLGDVVSRSGGSLATLYEMFDNKPGLLRAMVSHRCESLGASLEAALGGAEPVQEGLRLIGQHMYRELLNPRAVGLKRVVIAQTLIQPDLGKLLYESGPAAGQHRVAQYLEQKMRAGELRTADPMAASQMFFQMIMGHFQQLLLMGQLDMPSEDEKAEHLDFALFAFLKIYSPEPVRAEEK